MGRRQYEGRGGDGVGNVQNCILDGATERECRLSFSLLPAFVRYSKARVEVEKGNNPTPHPKKDLANANNEKKYLLRACWSVGASERRRDGATWQTSKTGSPRCATWPKTSSCPWCAHTLTPAHFISLSHDSTVLVPQLHRSGKTEKWKNGKMHLELFSRGLLLVHTQLPNTSGTSHPSFAQHLSSLPRTGEYPRSPQDVFGPAAAGQERRPEGAAPV